MSDAVADNLVSDEEQSGLDLAHRPVLLFDGVCNLCDATVQFVIERDAARQFRFASLQSQAASDLLQSIDGPAPEELPDSVVLIDERGLHLHSDAALRTARRLGWPVSALSAALLLPRPLRNWAYEIVARNRYRWFGKQTVCRLPSAAERALFLDADEPPNVVDHEPSEAAATGVGSATLAPASGLLALLLQRFLLVYTLVYMAPFPLSLLGYVYQLPGVSSLPQGVFAPLSFVLGLHGQFTQPIVEALASSFGVEVSFQPTGSGDRMANWLDALLDLVLALLLTIAWAVWRRRRAISSLVADAARTVLRYYLATTLIGYGFAKAFPLQFPAPGADRLMQAYGDSSPMGLLWTFMGASSGYQMFGGIMELLAGLLLLWRRTTLAGSLMAVAVMSNVVAMNFFFDVPVKLFSSHLLVFALLLAVPDVPRLFSVLFGNLTAAPRKEQPFYRERGRLVRIRQWVKPLLVLMVLWTQISMSWQRTVTTGVLAPVHPLNGIYRVEAFEVIRPDPLAEVGARAPEDGQTNTGDSAVQGLEVQQDAASTPESLVGGKQPVSDAERWVRVGIRAPWVGTVQTADGRSVRMRLRLDDEANTLALFDRGLSEPDGPPMTLQQPEEGVVVLQGPFEARQIKVVLRLEEDASLLTSRGFHWISEYPFNR